MGHLPRGPLAILKESWCGDEHLPVSFGKNASDYLTELHRKLEIAKHMLHPILNVNSKDMSHITICGVGTNILILESKF